MDNFRQIFWGHGQFLSPQHLQQQDLFHKTRLQYLWKAAQPYGWGLKSIHIREEALENNSLEITHCELVTREGEVIKAGTQMNEPNAILHPRNFEGLFDPSQGPLSVYLSLTRHQPGQNNLAKDTNPISDGQLSKRYVLAAKEQSDTYDVDSPNTNVIFVEYYLTIYFSSEEIFQASQRSLDCIKIAELVASGEQAGVRLSRHFIPPCIHISGSNTLIELIKNVRDLLAGRAQEFAAFVRERGMRATVSGTQDLLRTVMLQSLNRYIPVLQHIIENKNHHPEPIYCELRRLVGELSVFSESYNVFGAPLDRDDSYEVLPPYDHDDLWKCYNQAWLRIRELVIAMTSGPEHSVTLEYDGREYYKGGLTADFFEQPLSRYYLMIDSILQGQEITSRLQNTGKISCMEEMSLIRRSAVFGLKIDYMPTPPEELPQRSSRYTYFRIDTQSPQWTTIRQNRNIAVFCDLDPADTVIKIVRVGGP